MNKTTTIESTLPPFPKKMTFKEMFEGLFNHDFMSDEEFETICKAAEMYANGCLNEFKKRINYENKSQTMTCVHEQVDVGGVPTDITFAIQDEHKYKDIWWLVVS